MKILQIIIESVSFVHDYNKPFGINMKAENKNINNSLFQNDEIVEHQNKTFTQPDKTEKTKSQRTEKLTKRKKERVS